VPRVGRLEDRTCPDAATLAPGLPAGGVLAPGGSAYFWVVSTTDALLSATVVASGSAVRLSLCDARGVPLVVSDAGPDGASGPRVDEHVSAGRSLLEVQSLGGVAVYHLSADLTPAASPRQTVPVAFPNDAAPMAIGAFVRPGSRDLLAPDGVHPGAGDGTFGPPLPGWPPAGDAAADVSAIVAAPFFGGSLLDAAVETYSGGSGSVQLLQNEGGGTFAANQALSIDPSLSPGPLAVGNFGGGGEDLAVGLSGEVSEVEVFRNDGRGGFIPSAVIPVGSDPIALAVGHFGGQGGDDLAVAFDGSSPEVEVFRNDGRGGFTPGPPIPLGSTPDALVAGDFNGDQYTDLAVADFDTGQIYVLVGQGGGRFAERAPNQVGQNPVALVTADFNGDGRTDLAVANNFSGDVSVLLGNGDGTFRPAIVTQTGERPASLAAGDINGDGREDLAVGSSHQEGVTVLLGRGDGGFQVPPSNPVGEEAVAAATGVFTRSGHLDLVTANLGSDDVSLLLGNGDGTFQPARSIPAGPEPVAVAVGDFNDDSRLDLAVADQGTSDVPDQGVTILLGNGDGTFQFADPSFYPIPGPVQAIAAGDFDGNGTTDLAVSVYGNATDTGVYVLKGDGRGGFSAPVFFPMQGEPAGLVTADFNGDGKTDLAVLDQLDDCVTVFPGDAQRSLGPARSYPLRSASEPQGNDPFALVAGNFVGDGHLDLAVSDYDASQAQTENVTILRGDGRGGFLPSVTVALGTTPIPNTAPLAAGHFNSKQYDDLVIGNDVSGEVTVLSNDGHGSFRVATSWMISPSATPGAVAAGDFDSNGLDDVAVATQTPNEVTLELSQGGGRFASPGDVALDPRDTPVVADIDGDGIRDLTLVDGSGEILFRRGQAVNSDGFDPPITVNPGDPSRAVAAVMTAQGYVLASADATDNAISLFAYQGGRFRPVGSLVTGQEPAQVIAANLDGDGRTDLVVRDAGDGTLSVFMSDGRGGFFPRLSIPVGPGVSDVEAADVSGDGTLDLLVTDQVTGQVEVLVNQGGGIFRPPTPYRAGVGPSGVTAGDTVGTWTVSSLEGTAGVVAGMFNAGGAPGLVTLNPGSETVGLLAGLGGGRFANPTALETRGPATAAVVVGFGDGRPSDLALLGPDGVTIEQGDGRGGFRPNPEFFPVNDPTGLATADLNGDGIPDLIVGNAYGDVLVLRGGADGSFQTPRSADQGVFLAVGTVPGSGATLFVLADQALDRVVVLGGSAAQPTVLGDRTTGLLAPSAVTLDDLNGDGIPDLIVLNSGGNDVLVYPGLGNGQFGRELDGGLGFATGTDPVAVTVASLNGRRDLIIANKGSNDVSILLNEARGAGFTFVEGPRLRVGLGPVSTAVVATSGGVQDLLVSDSLSNDVRRLPGRSAGFFDDGNPVIIPLNNSPGQISVGQFVPGGPSAAVLIPLENAVDLISSLTGESPAVRSFPSGGVDPVSALAVPVGNGFDDLIVANNGDGLVRLLAGGPDGMILEADAPPALADPTSLARAFLVGDELGVYAATEGSESVVLLMFALGGTSDSVTPAPGLTLLPPVSSSFPIVATLLTTGVNTTLDESITADFATEALSSGPSIPSSPTTSGQSILSSPSASNGSGDGEERDGTDAPVEGSVVIQAAADGPDPSPWMRDVLGLDEAFEQFERGPEGRSDEPTGGAPAPPPQPGAPVGPRPQASTNGTTGMIDAAIDALGSELSQATRLRTMVDHALPYHPGMPETPRSPAPAAPKAGQEGPAQGPTSIMVPAALFAGYLARSDHGRPVLARGRKRRGLPT
jgi:hypothetical protein